MSYVKCLSCSKIFHAKPNRIARGWGKYCSQACKHIGFKTGDTFECGTCGTKIYRSLKNQSRSKSKTYFCSKSCQTLWRNKLYVGESHSNWLHGMASYRQRLERSGRKMVCSRCGTNDRRILVVHHRDKNRKNNTIKNLLWMCHNCHYLIHHYKSESTAYMVPVA